MKQQAEAKARLAELSRAAAADKARAAKEQKQAAYEELRAERERAAANSQGIAHLLRQGRHKQAAVTCRRGLADTDISVCNEVSRDGAAAEGAAADATAAAGAAAAEAAKLKRTAAAEAAEASALQQGPATPKGQVQPHPLPGSGLPPSLGALHMTAGSHVGANGHTVPVLTLPGVPISWEGEWRSLLAPWCSLFAGAEACSFQSPDLGVPTVACGTRGTRGTTTLARACSKVSSKACTRVPISSVTLPRLPYI